MQRTGTLYHNAVFAFIALAMAAAVGFWPTYFSRLSESSIHAHAHGLAMSAWVLLLIGQAYLIRTGRRSIHRQLGKLSFVLVPIIVLATMSFANASLRDDGLVAFRLHIFYIQVHLVFLFVLAYTLAIRNRRNPAVHARFMICTALTLLDPIFARVIIFNIWMPDNIAYVQAITYALVDLILIGLIASDWRREWRLRVYPAMLAAFVTLQVPNFLVVQTGAWRSFAAWFQGLPLS